jgi:hypothetical protein
MTALIELEQTQVQESRETLVQRRVMERVLDAVQHLGDSLASRTDAKPLTPQQRQVLTLLTYCYAVGIYGSEDVEWACRNHAGVRYAAANLQPHWATIRSFRREHRDWIESCLAGVLSSAGCRENPAISARAKLEIAVSMDTAMCE